MKTKGKTAGVQRFAPAVKKVLSLLLAVAMLFSITAGIELSAYADMGAYEYSVLDDGTVEITFYSGSDLESDIPETINGKMVTSIGEGAFADCDSLRNVTIPESVKNIGENAFNSCDGLTSLTIPNSVTSIGEGAFYKCENLSSINVDANNKIYSSVNGVLYNKGRTELIVYPAGKMDASFTIPNSVTGIAAGAFAGCKYLTSILIPNSVKSIGEMAFSICSGLISVTIPSSVTSIGDRAFFSSGKLKNISVDSNNKNYASAGGVLYNKNKTELIIYPAGKADTSFTIPNSVICITEAAFFGCESLTKVTIPSSVMDIGDEAFMNCISLGNVTVPDSVIKIGVLSFCSCTGLTSITIYNKDILIMDYAIDVSTTIYGYKDSTAENYAWKRGNKFVALSETKLATPTLKAAVNANGSFKLSWNKVNGAEKYELYIKQADGSYKLMKTTTATSFTTAFATYGKQFSYKIRAVNSKNKSLTSAYSSVVNATNNKKLQTPTMKASVNANGTFKLSWNKVAGADKYELYIKQVNGSYKLMKTTTATSFTTAFATYGKQFSYKMRAVNSKNSSATSAYSAVVNAKNTKKLQTPAMKVTVNTNGSFKLSWNKVEGATSYQLYIKQANGSYKLMKTTTSTSFTTAVAAKGKTYSYKMVAVTSKNKNATSNYSNVVNAKRK